jgi:hypothetical protein
MERVFGTLQKRLPQELPLAKIRTMAAANRFLRERFVPDYNARFAVPAAEPGSAFVPYVGRPIEDVLCVQEDRVVGADNCVSWQPPDSAPAPSPSLRPRHPAKDRGNRGAARHVVDVHRRKTALVMMCVPERELLAAMRGTERVVDVQDLERARFDRLAELIDQGPAQSRRLALAGRVLQATDGRLRGQRRTALRTTADRDLHQRIVAKPIEIVRILVAARDRRAARHHHLEHRVPDAVRIAAIRHRFRKPPAHPELALGFSQQQQTSIGRLVTTLKINCELLAVHRWQVEGEQRIVGHGGCGTGLIREATRRSNDLLCESASSRHSRRKIIIVVHNLG